MSNDDETREILRAREDSEHERANLISTGVDRGIEIGKKMGIEEGIEKGKLEAARALLDILDDKTIAEKLELNEDVVRKLREEAKL